MQFRKGRAVKGPKARAKSYVARNATVYNTTRNAYTTIVKACIKVDGRRFDGVGMACCSPSDTFNRSLGVKIARGRACKDIALQMVAAGVPIGIG